MLNLLLLTVSAQQATADHPYVRTLFRPPGVPVHRHVRPDLRRDEAGAVRQLRQQLAPQRHPSLQRHSIQGVQVNRDEVF